MKMEVAFYPGCTAHSTGLEYSMSLHAVLEKLDVSLVEIDNWNCCGAAAAHSVDKLLGLALPGFPNLFFVYGPNTNLGHNSILFMIECQVHAILGALRRMRRQRAARIEVTDAAMTRYSQKLRHDLGRTAWAGCLPAGLASLQAEFGDGNLEAGARAWKRASAAVTQPARLA